MTHPTSSLTTQPLSSTHPSSRPDRKGHRRQVMKEITTMPTKVSNGNKEIEVYESSSGFCMTTEFLGQCLGYSNPRDKMSKLFRRHKEALHPHRFVAFESYKPMGGKPTNFYDEGGIVKAFMLANTPQAKEFGPKVIDYLETLKAKRMERIERYWFGKRPYWPEIRDRVMLGQSFREIAEAMVRSTASVRNAVRRMIEVGILQPMRAAQALTGTAKKAVIRYSRKYMSEDRQPLLPGFGLQSSGVEA